MCIKRRIEENPAVQNVKLFFSESSKSMVFSLKKNIASIKLFQMIVLSLFFFLFFVPSSFSAPTSFIAEVVAVLNGDTIKVLKSRRVLIIRLEGVDSPESEQRYGKQSKDFTESIAFGQKVVINLKGIDRNDRMIAEVIMKDGRSLNREVVKAGFAWWQREYSEDLSLWRLEDQARDKKLGLWLGKDPVPPWEFRESMGK